VSDDWEAIGGSSKRILYALTSWMEILLALILQMQKELLFVISTVVDFIPNTKQVAVLNVYT
jgi:hypothetical protein